MKYLLLLALAFTAHADPEMTYDYENDTWVHIEKVAPDMVYKTPLETMEPEPMMIIDETPDEIWLIDLDSNEIEVYQKED